MLKILGLVVFVVTLARPLAATAAPDGPIIVTPANVAWAPGTGHFAGTLVAVSEGDPAKPGPYSLRLKLPDGATFAPHSHADVEHVTVLSGTLLVGLGDKLDVAHMKALDAGAYVIIPSGLHHFAMAKGTTIVQIHGNGPSSFDMVEQGK